MNPLNKDTITKTIRFDIETHNKIEKLAEQSERDFSAQVRFICKEYLSLKESK